jgi:hypothetical protein
MSLPDGCEVTESHLVFWELSTENQLAETDRLYEYCCTVACTNGLRPLGRVEVISQVIPEVQDGEVFFWGPRQLSAEAAAGYAEAGYVLCELKLPVQSMGAPVPPGVALGRPPRT